MRKHDAHSPAAKARRLAIYKTTLKDLDVRDAGAVRGGTQLVTVTDPITATAPKTVLAPTAQTISVTCYACR